MNASNNSTQSYYSSDKTNEILPKNVNINEYKEYSDCGDLSDNKNQLKYPKNVLFLSELQASIKPNLNNLIRNNNYSTNKQMISNNSINVDDTKILNGKHSISTNTFKTPATVEVDSNNPNSGHDLRWRKCTTNTSSADFNTTINNGISDSGKSDNTDLDNCGRKLILSRSNFHSSPTAATVVTSNTSTAERRLLQNNSNNPNFNQNYKNFHTLNYHQFNVVPTLYSTFLIPTLYSLNSLIFSNNLYNSTSQNHYKYQINNKVQLSNESIAGRQRKDSIFSEKFNLISNKIEKILSHNDLKTAIATKTTTITKTNNTNHQQQSSSHEPPPPTSIDPLVFPARNGIFNRNDEISTNIGKEYFSTFSFSTASFGGGNTTDYLSDDDNPQPQAFYFNDIDIDNNNDEDNDVLLSSLLDEEYSIEERGELNYHNIFSRPQFRHLTLADKHRLERLFKEIDVDGNGVIDFNDLLQTLEQKGIQATHENVKHLILRSDSNLDGDIDFAEFVTYCLENEKQLRIIFKDIDVNADGKIDTHELVLAFERAGIKVDQQEALKLVKRIKTDSKNRHSRSVDNTTLELDYNEFRDYLLLHPTDSLQDLMRSWRFGTFVDLGEDGIMPVDFSENEIKTGMWWRHMLAGGIAGAVSRTSTAPLDRLKVFLQVRGAEFNGLGVCLKHMIQEGGVISLWRGNGINVLKIAPETALKFMAFDQLKRLFHSGSPNSEINIIERFLAGSLAGAVSQTVIYPMEVLKTRFCLRQTGQYRGLWDAAYKIYSNGGIKNFYRGYVPNLIGIIPYAGIDLTIYETLKKMYMKSHSLEEAPVYVCLTCGTVSSTFGQIASYPLALIRTRMQSEIGHHSSSMIDMFRTTVKNEGIRGLYRGITANIMKVAPAVSISYVVYEYTRRPLGAIMS